MHGKIKVWQGALTPGVEKMTRQRVRAKLREECFDEVNAQSRHWNGDQYVYNLTQAQRRQWALAEAHSRYRAQKGLPSGV